MQNIYLFTLEFDATKANVAMRQLCAKAGIETHHREFFHGLKTLPDLNVVANSPKPQSFKTFAENTQKQARARHN